MSSWAGGFLSVRLWGRFLLSILSKRVMSLLWKSMIVWFPSLVYISIDLSWSVFMLYDIGSPGGSMPGGSRVWFLDCYHLGALVLLLLWSMEGVMRPSEVYSEAHFIKRICFCNLGKDSNAPLRIPNWELIIHYPLLLILDIRRGYLLWSAPSVLDSTACAGLPSLRACFGR